MPAVEASLVLYAPGLGAPRVHFVRKIDDLKIYELGHWRPTVGASPEAEIVLLRFTPVAPSGMTWRSEPPLEERIRRWFRSDSIDLGAGGKYENVLGEVEYSRFTRNGATECVFMRQYGDTYSDQRGYFSDGGAGLGDIMIRGYYCVAPGEQLSQATLGRFLAGIGLKGFGVPEEPRDLALPGQSAALAAGTSIQRKSTRSDAFPYVVRFTSAVFKTSEGHELADEFDEVAFDHGRVYLYVAWRGVTKESHLAQLRVFDGVGKQVGASSYEFTPTSTRWNTWLHYKIDPDWDQPGNWRFELDLDGETLVERSLIVTPPGYGSAQSGTNATSREAAVRQYHKTDEALEYKVFVRNEYGAWAWIVRETFMNAKTEALTYCQKRSAEYEQPGMCRIYAVGDDVVWDMLEKDRLKIIEAYSK